MRWSVKFGQQRKPRLRNTRYIDVAQLRCRDIPYRKEPQTATHRTMRAVRPRARPTKLRTANSTNADGAVRPRQQALDVNRDARSEDIGSGKVSTGFPSHSSLVLVGAGTR